MSLPNDSTRNKALRTLGRSLLAGTCLTAATLAHAGTITETTDFANTLELALLSPLPVGTDVVNGSLNFSEDTRDFIDFAGLLGGGSFTLEFAKFAGDLQFSVSDSAGVSLGSGGASFTGTIPVDGQLVAAIAQFEGSTYQVTLTAPLAPSVPEPATAAMTGLGLTAAALLATKRRKLSR